MKNLIIALSAVLLLSGCASTMGVTVSPLKRETLKITPQPPLDLRPVQFHVFVQNGEPVYALDSQGFSNLSNNMEKIQNRLDQDEQTIVQILQYYDEDLPTTIVK